MVSTNFLLNFFYSFNKMFKTFNAILNIIFLIGSLFKISKIKLNTLYYSIF